MPIINMSAESPKVKEKFKKNVGPIRSRRVRFKRAPHSTTAELSAVQAPALELDALETSAHLAGLQTGGIAPRSTLFFWRQAEPLLIIIYERVPKKSRKNRAKNVKKNSNFAHKMCKFYFILFIKCDIIC